MPRAVDASIINFLSDWIHYMQAHRDMECRTIKSGAEAPHTCIIYRLAPKHREGKSCVRFGTSCRKSRTPPQPHKHAQVHIARTTLPSQGSRGSQGKSRKSRKSKAIVRISLTIGSQGSQGSQGLLSAGNACNSTKPATTIQYDIHV
jgi:hypothetical protein